MFSDWLRQKLGFNDGSIENENMNALSIYIYHIGHLLYMDLKCDVYVSRNTWDFKKIEEFGIILFFIFSYKKLGPVN